MKGTTWHNFPQSTSLVMDISTSTKVLIITSLDYKLHNEMGYWHPEVDCGRTSFTNNFKEIELWEFNVTDTAPTTKVCACLQENHNAVN